MASENNMRKNEDADVSDRASSLVRFVVIIITTLIVVVGGGIGLASAMYSAGKWTGEINSKLGLILSRVDSLATLSEKADSIIKDHEKRLTNLEALGSKNAQEMRKELDELKETVKLHLVSPQK